MAEAEAGRRPRLGNLALAAVAAEVVAPRMAVAAVAAEVLVHLAEMVDFPVEAAAEAGSDHSAAPGRAA